MRPINEEIRTRVIKSIEKGNSYVSAARQFEVSTSAVRRWYLRYKETGSYAPKPFPGKKARINRTEFINYVNSNPNATLAQIGVYFKMTARSIHYYMQKFGFSYKKKSQAIWKQKKSREDST